MPCVCVCVCVPPISRRALKTKRCKLLGKHNVVVLKNSPRRLLPVERWPSCSQQTTVQHDSSICTTNQIATWVKSRERDCQSYKVLLHVARRCSYTSKHRRFQTACNWRRGPVLAPWAGTRPTALVYTNWSLTALLLLISLLCLPAAANFYIMVFHAGCRDCSFCTWNACLCW